MSELKLYKFVHENGLEYHRYEEWLYLYIPLSLINDFCKMLSYNFFDEPFEVMLKYDYICVEMTGVCENFDIEIEKIFEEVK